MRVLMATGVKEIDKSIADELAMQKIEVAGECYYREALLSLAQERQVDVIVVSPHLPGEKETIDLIKDLRMAGLRLVLLPGRRDDEDAVRLASRAAALGVYDILWDPVAPERVAKRVLNPATLAEAGVEPEGEVSVSTKDASRKRDRKDKRESVYVVFGESTEKVSSYLEGRGYKIIGEDRSLDAAAIMALNLDERPDTYLVLGSASVCGAVDVGIDYGEALIESLKKLKTAASDSRIVLILPESVEPEVYQKILYMGVYDVYKTGSVSMERLPKMLSVRKDIKDFGLNTFPVPVDRPEKCEIVVKNRQKFEVFRVLTAFLQTLFHKINVRDRFKFSLGGTGMVLKNPVPASFPFKHGVKEVTNCESLQIPKEMNHRWDDDPGRCLKIQEQVQSARSGKFQAAELPDAEASPLPIDRCPPKIEEKIHKQGFAEREDTKEQFQYELSPVEKSAVRASEEKVVSSEQGMPGKPDIIANYRVEGSWGTQKEEKIMGIPEQEETTDMTNSDASKESETIQIGVEKPERWNTQNERHVAHVWSPPKAQEQISRRSGKIVALGSPWISGGTPAFLALLSKYLSGRGAVATVNCDLLEGYARNGASAHLIKKTKDVQWLLIDIGDNPDSRSFRKAAGFADVLLWVVRDPFWEQAKNRWKDRPKLRCREVMVLFGPGDPYELEDVFVIPCLQVKSFDDKKGMERLVDVLNSSSRGLRALLVGFSEIPEVSGFTCDSFQTAEEAMKWIEYNPPDAAVLCNNLRKLSLIEYDLIRYNIPVVKTDSSALSDTLSQLLR